MHLKPKVLINIVKKAMKIIMVILIIIPPMKEEERI